MAGQGNPCLPLHTFSAPEDKLSLNLLVYSSKLHVLDLGSDRTCQTSTDTVSRTLPRRWSEELVKQVRT